MKAAIKNAVVNKISVSFQRFIHLVIFQRINVTTLVFMYLTVAYLKRFSSYSGIGYIDPWINVGYGQSFPKSAFPWHYYKESRFFTIFLEHFLVKLSSSQFEIAINVIVSLTAFYFFLRLRKFGNSSLVSIIFSTPILLSTLLWGDAAGGIDYYNTFGNIAIVFFLSALLKSSFDYGHHKLNPKNFVVLGFISFFITFEVPSGVTVVTCGGLYFMIQALILRKSRIVHLDFKFFLRASKYFIAGAVSTLVFQVFFYIFTQENPVKTLTGIKYLFVSITDPEIQSAWWNSLSGRDFLDLPYLRLFFFLVISSLFFSIVVTRLPRNEMLPSVNDLRALNLSYLIVSLIIIFLQFSGGSVAISLQYMAVPLLLFGYLIFVYSVSKLIKLQSNVASSFIGISLFFVSYFFVLTFEKLLIVFSIIYILALLFMCVKRFRTVAVGVLSLTIILTVPSITQAFVRISLGLDSQNSQFCNLDRKQFREDLLTISKKLDGVSLPRGSILLAGDNDLLFTSLFSGCDAHKRLTMGDAMVSFAALGFPAVSILGPVQTNVPVNYYSTLFSEPLRREGLMNRCYVLASVAKRPDFDESFKIRILNNVAWLNLDCTYKVD
jgi:hypothetical protein